MSKRKIAICSSVLIVIAILIIILLMRGCNASDSQAGGMTYDENAHDYTVSLPVADTNGIAIPGYSTVYFPSGEKNVPMTLYNPDKNTCLFQFELYINDETEPIAETGLIEPGKAVESVVLSRALKSGNYKLKIKVNTYTDDGQLTPLNNALVSAELCVLPA